MTNAVGGKRVGRRMLRGVAPIRLAAVAFLCAAGVAHAAVMPEIEPNDLNAGATPLGAGDIGQGMINPIGEVDAWVRSGVPAGHLIFCYISTLDAMMSDDSEFIARDNSENAIEGDNDSGPGDSSCIAGAIVPEDGNVYLRVRESGDNQILDTYEVYQAIIDPADGVAETGVNDAYTLATPITGPMMTGTIGSFDTDYFSFSARAGQTIVVICDEDPDDDGSGVDADLEIMSSNGVVPLAYGDNSGVEDANAAGPVDVGADGVYYIRIEVGSGAPGGYRLVVLVDGEPACLDADFDGVCDHLEPCYGIGDADGDGVCDDVDNCPDMANGGQADADGDGTGDVCDETPAGDPCAGNGDADGDGVCDDVDNCPFVPNAVQADGDGDGTGDECDETPAGGPCGSAGDADGDGVCDDVDNCPGEANPSQLDTDGDGAGNACDATPAGDCTAEGDLDGDGVCNDVDNCPEASNAGQDDADGDGVGDVCDETPTGEPPAGSAGDMCGMGSAASMTMAPLMLIGMQIRRRRRISHC